MFNKPTQNNKEACTLATQTRWTIALKTETKVLATVNGIRLMDTSLKQREIPQGKTHKNLRRVLRRKHGRLDRELP